MRRYPDCKKCRATKARLRYRGNKKLLIYQAKLNRAKRRKLCQQISRQEKNKPCVDCNRKYPHYVMDFDHVRGKKSAHVAHLVSRGCSEEVLRAEIAKCEVVCANCHRERTHG